jgi:charged multivesicular body protein 6
VLHGLKQGNDVLKEIHKELNVESVEKLLEETAEARAYQKVYFILLHTSCHTF